MNEHDPNCTVETAHSVPVDCRQNPHKPYCEGKCYDCGVKLPDDFLCSHCDECFAKLPNKEVCGAIERVPMVDPDTGDADFFPEECPNPKPCPDHEAPKEGVCSGDWKTCPDGYNCPHKPKEAPATPTWAEEFTEKWGEVCVQRVKELLSTQAKDVERETLEWVLKLEVSSTASPAVQHMQYTQQIHERLAQLKP